PGQSLGPTRPFFPFNDRHAFDWAHFHFVELQASARKINTGLDLWVAAAVTATCDPDTRIQWKSERDLYKTIDDIQQGSAPFITVIFKYTGKLPENPPAWMTEEYELCVRDAREVLCHQLSTTEFLDQFKTAPYRQFEVHGEQQRVWSNLMSGDWAWEEVDTIASQVEGSEGAMLVPIVSGLDKTTVSVATGHQEYHPFYISAGNLTNTARRSHGAGVIPVAFLPIPKSMFYFRSLTMYHACIARIFAPLRQYMTSADILRCPDGHLRRAIYSIGPVIADYPEQVWLSCIVQYWCLKCMAKPDDLDNPDAHRRTQEKMEILIECFDPGVLWKLYGIWADIWPFTYEFPRADIHKLMAPDLLHQVIKGSFKDHLVQWVMDYINEKYTPVLAIQIIADIDRRVSAVPIFPGLHRFKDGQNFSQWTGDDSKAFMKVYLGAIKGYVPDDMVRCIASFLNVCYIFRRNTITSSALKLAQLELAKFHCLCKIFITTGTRTTCSLPNQHALTHFPQSIQQFRSPNGLCSSITESKHITAVKEPWRRSNCFNALQQMLTMITRLNKIHALRKILAHHGMLDGSTSMFMAQALLRRGDRGPESDVIDDPDNDEESTKESAMGNDQSQIKDVTPKQGPRLTAFVEMGLKHGIRYPSKLSVLAQHRLVREPRLQTTLIEYLWALQYPGQPIPLDISADAFFTGKIRVYHSASAHFYAPSDACGSGGMQKQVVHSNPNWKGSPRHDTVFVTDNETPTICGMKIAQIRLFFTYADIQTGEARPCALVDWFHTVGGTPDHVTGMWVVEWSPCYSEHQLSVIPLQSIIRGAHLVPVYEIGVLPEQFSFTTSLDAFKRYYVNSYVDHHTHELLSDL
ncbi:hypothetical protein FA15DRAFT_583187, partial [Coprinopsis marcescibilis]